VQYLQSVRLKRGQRLPAGYPFELPLVQQLEAMTFDAPVTFFVGENGAGKSTMLEAIAAAANSITIGGVEISNDVTLVPARALADRLTLS
jgi:predicted ATPase